MHKGDKQLIAQYRKILTDLGKIEMPGDLVKTKEGFLRKRVVSRHVTFKSLEEAKQAKRQATELMRETKTYIKKINDVMKSIRQMYKEAAGNVGSGAGLMGFIVGKQNIISEKADKKRGYMSERDERLENYTQLIKEFEGRLYTFNVIKSDAEDFISQRRP